MTPLRFITLPTMPETPEDKIAEAIRNPQNMGEMPDADAVGTVGSPECGDMLRMWLKFREVDGEKVIDRASFQSFGCQTAIAVASVATGMIKGKTIGEALELSADHLSAPLGPIPPMKIHCGQMVEGALRDALAADRKTSASAAPGVAVPAHSPTLLESLSGGPRGKKIKIIKLDDGEALENGP